MKIVISFFLIFAGFSSALFSQSEVQQRAAVDKMTKTVIKIVDDYISMYTELTDSQSQKISDKIELMATEMGDDLVMEVSHDPLKCIDIATEIRTYIISDVLTKDQVNVVNSPDIMESIKFILSRL